MKKFILFLVLIPLFTSSFSQTFQKVYGWAGTENCYSVKQTTDGGYVMAGFTNSLSANFDGLVIKVDPNGIIQWSKGFATPTNDFFEDVIEDNLGNFVLVGGNNGGLGNTDNSIAKLDAAGNQIWSINKGDAGYNYNSHSLKQTTDGGYIQLGYNATITGNGDFWLLKTDVNGNTTWSKWFNTSTGGYDHGFYTQQTTDGGYVIAGIWNNVWSAMNGDMRLLKTNATGGITWAKSYGAAGHDYLSSARQTTDGGYILAGLTLSFGAGSSDFYLVKTDISGNLMWSKTYGGVGSDQAYSVVQTSDGGYALVGTTNSFGAGGRDVWLVRTDALGNLLWSRTFGGALDDNPNTSTTFGSQYNSLVQTSDGGFLIGAQTRSFGSGNEDIYLIKTDASGSSGCNETSPVPIVTNPATVVGNPAYTTGNFSTSGATGTINNNAPTVIDLCIVPLPVTLLSFNVNCQDEEINLNWVTTTEINNDFFTIEKSTDAINWEIITQVNGAGNSNQIISYSYNDNNASNELVYYRLKQTDFDGDFEYFDINAVNCQNNSTVSIYPNPAANNFTTELTGKEGDVFLITLYNAIGKQVIQQKVELLTNSTKEKITTNALPNGMYSIKVEQNNNNIITKKIVISH